MPQNIRSGIFFFLEFELRKYNNPPCSAQDSAYSTDGFCQLYAFCFGPPFFFCFGCIND